VSLGRAQRRHYRATVDSTRIQYSIETECERGVTVIHGRGGNANPPVLDLCITEYRDTVTRGDLISTRVI